MKEVYFNCSITDSIVKLHILLIKKSLTHDLKKHHGREHLINAHYFREHLVEYISSTYRVKPHVTKKQIPL